MTDRHAGYVVTLEHDVRDDNAERSVITALMMVKGVISVEPVVASVDIQVAQARARVEFARELSGTLERLGERRLADG